LRIYCDMDDILCETAVSLCGLAFRLFGRRVDYEQVREFNLQTSFSLSDEEFRRFMDIAHEPENLMAYDATPGALAGFRALADAGHEVEVVTGRPAFTFRATRTWLDAAGFGAFPVTYVDKYNRPNPVDPEAPKAIPLAEFMTRRYDVAIDDSPVILPTLAQWKDTRVVVFDRPWNRDFALAPNMVRAKDWKELESYVVTLPPARAPAVR